MHKILLIEDEPSLIKAYSTVLIKEKFLVEVAEDGEEGLEKAVSFKPDLILLDMLMPKMNGLEFLTKFNKNKNYPDVKIIVFSNFSTPEKIEQALELGATTYKTKAFFSPKEIIELIRETLKK